MSQPNPPPSMIALSVASHRSSRSVPRILGQPLDRDGAAAARLAHGRHRRKLAISRKPGRLALFRVELRADEIVAADHGGDRRRHIRWSASKVGGFASGEAGSCARNRRGRRARARRAPDAALAARSSFQPMCGILSAGSAGLDRAPPRRRSSRGPSTVSNSRPRSAISCMPTQMPRNGRPRAITASLQRRLRARARAASPRAAIGEGADARQHDAVGRGDLARASLVTSDVPSAMPVSRAARSKALAAERRLPEP